MWPMLTIEYTLYFHKSFFSVLLTTKKYELRLGSLNIAGLEPNKNFTVKLFDRVAGGSITHLDIVNIAELLKPYNNA